MVKGVLKPRAQGRKPPANKHQRNQLAPVEEPSSEEFDDFGRALDAAAPAAAGRRRRPHDADTDADGSDGDDEQAVLGVSSDDDSDDDADDDSSGSGSEDDDDEDDDDDDGANGASDGGDDDLDALIARGGKTARLAKQAKHLGEQLRIERGERDTESGEEGEEGGKASRQRNAAGGAAAWGANKRRYYGGGTESGSDEGEGDEDEEDEDAAARAEEQEARRLQAERAAGLAAEDFGLDSDDDEDDDDEEDDEDEDEDEDGHAAAGRNKKAPLSTERVAKAALADLPDEARRAALEADAPELLALVDELRGALGEVRARCGPLLREVRAGGLATGGGLSYLEAKHLLLTQYCACLVAYLLLRAEGKPVRGHPVVARLVQLRAYLERARPIDRRLAYQVDKLLRATSAAQQAEQAMAAAAGGGGSGGDADAAAAAAAGAAGASLRPNPAAFVGADEAAAEGRRQQQQRRKQGGEGEDADGADADADPANDASTYRPPRLNPASMEIDAEIGPDGQPVRRATARERHALREAARRARRSELVQELAAELTGAPEELRAEVPGLDSSAALLAARQRMEARERAEEELFARVPLSKAEAKKLKAQRRAGLAGAGGALDDFADEVADLVGGAGGAGGKAAGILGRLSQRFGADLADQAAADGGGGGGGGLLGTAARSGDADLSRRPTLHERRAAFDGAAGRKAARQALEESEMPPPLKPGSKRGYAAEGADEDEFYAASREARQQAKRAKGELAQQQRAAERMLPPPLPDSHQQDGELRPITDAIQRNRGLTPHRRRDVKNPRKKHRVKYAEAGVRLKGQVQGVREAPATAGGYGGEATGIKARLARGRKLS
jgi:U3 small nucleolar RNA-associated protein 3